MEQFISTYDVTILFKLSAILTIICAKRPPLWSSGYSFWPQIQGSQVRFPSLPDFLSSSGFGIGSIQPREDN
jgi:hypothetical protein